MLPHCLRTSCWTSVVVRPWGCFVNTYAWPHGQKTNAGGLVSGLDGETNQVVRGWCNQPLYCIYIYINPYQNARVLYMTHL